MVQDRFKSPEYAASEYRDSSNLNARVQLHDRFSTNHYGWGRWVFDQLHLKSQSKILELGCGAGGLWRRNLDRIPEGCHVILSDFSEGVLRDARQNLAGERIFEFKIVDANDKPLPFSDASFDTVIANHMLYYISDRDGLFSEIRRILKPNGQLYASTVGQRPMTEIGELISEFDPAAGAAWENVLALFTLENGRAQLSPWFAHISLYRYENGLVVNELTPLLDYIFSGWTDLAEDRQGSFKDFVKQKLEEHGGVLHITKDSGIFGAIRV